MSYEQHRSLCETIRQVSEAAAREPAVSEALRDWLSWSETVLVGVYYSKTARAAEIASRVAKRGRRKEHPVHLLADAAGLAAGAVVDVTRHDDDGARAKLAAASIIVERLRRRGWLGNRAQIGVLPSMDACRGGTTDNESLKEAI